MNKQFRYTVLRYRPSYLLSENVNIGLLFYFPSDKNLSFIYPSNLERISKLFPGLANISDIHEYLKAFERRADQLSREDELFNLEFENDILERFIVKDANSFYFSESKYGQYNDASEILKYYRRQYFNSYYSPDSFIRNQFEIALKKSADVNSPSLKLFQRKISIDNKINTTEFDFAWQNGKTNLVKALGFDFKYEENIQTKAFRWLGELTSLKEFVPSENIKFDFLVSKPKEQTLIKAYYQALEILRSLDAHKEIIEEEDLELYAKEAIETIRPFSFENLISPIKKSN